jgi:thiamine biosynthesis protein ThiI
VIPFTHLQLEINKHFPSNYSITIMRRMMYRIAERVAKMSDALVLVNGESLGQVASQTIESIHAINEVTNMPVFRPLIAMDKLEIIAISKKIDTYDLSILPYEDCCTIFVPTNPVTKPYLKKIHYEESQFDYETLIQEAIDQKEIIIIDENHPLNLVNPESTEDLF